MPAAIVIPACLEPLTHERRWLVWRQEQTDKGRLTKVPYRGDQPANHAKSNDPATWCDFETASRAYSSGGVDGIGFALLNSNVVAFDIDDCRDEAAGNLHPWAKQLIARCGSYAEVTPGREGIRILGTGNGPRIQRKFAIADGVSVEIYRNCERFIAVTGNWISADLDRLADMDSIADQVVAELDAAKQGKQPQPLLRAHDGKPHQRELADIIKNGCGASFGGDKSRAVWHVIHAMLERGQTKNEITAVLIDPGNGISTHLLSRKEDPTAYAHRQIDKAMLERSKHDARTIDGRHPEGAEIIRLAELSPLHYDRQRKTAARRLGVRSGVLDRLVQAERKTPFGIGSQGHVVVLPEPKFWEHPVDGAALLDQIVHAIQRFVVLSDHAARACACWVVHTFLTDGFLVSPRLSISSPTKGCGKTTLLDVVFRLVLRPLMASNVTAAAIFRTVEKYKPCLLIDEADTFLGVNNELRGILNSGHRKGGAVLRVTGDDLEPRQFATFGPCAIALIGTLPSTLADRSIPIELNRRRPNERVESYRPDRAGHLDQLARQAARWAQDNAIAVGAADPEMPEEITNRARDNWRVLKAIATVAGGQWPGYIDEAAKATQARVGQEASSRLELLLGDIRALGFSDNHAEVRSADLVQRLIELEGRPWAEFGRSGKPLTQNSLARILKPLGISPNNVGPENSRARGYKREQFQDAFERYLPPIMDPEVHRCTECDEIRVSCISEPHSKLEGCAVEKDEKSNNDGLLGGCAVAGGDLPSELSDYRIRELAAWYVNRGEAERQETGTIRQAELDEALRKVLTNEGVFQEFIEVEFERVMGAVFASS
jgi:putative DNA primase/helicase